MNNADKITSASMAAVALIAIPVHFLNHEIFFAINGWHPEFFGYPMLLLTSLADGFFVLMISTLLHPIYRGRLLTAVVAFAIAGALVQLLKHVTGLDRPLRVFGDERVFLMGMRITADSFPSGHSATAFVLLRYLIDDKNNKIVIPLLILAFLAAISRVYIGVHFPIDVIVGAFIGYGVAELLFRFTDAGSPRFEKLVKYQDVTANTWGVLVSCGYLFFYLEKTKELQWLLDPIVVAMAAYFAYRLFMAIRAQKT